MLRIAIQPDEVIHPNGERQSFSERWFELAEDQDIDAIAVDVFSADAVSRIAACDAFMWRCPSSAAPRVYARRLFEAVEAGLGMPVFPSTRSAWIYEDKLGQYYFFEAASIPHAATWIFWARDAAERFCANARYPFVVKLAGGQQSSNVQLVRTQHEARFYVDELFCHGVASLGYRPASQPRRLLRRLHAAAQVVEGHNPYAPTSESELQCGYFYAQEFIPDNTFEVSVIVIGNRAFVCRRFIADGDFRTRGSNGRMDFTPDAAGADAARLAYRVTHKLGAHTMGVDILHRGAEPIVVELTVNYASWVVRACPGHWELEGEPESGTVTWVEGCVRAADAVLDDFVARIRRSAQTSTRRAATVIPSP